MHCNATATANDEPDAWPSDFNDSQFTGLEDVVLMGPVLQQILAQPSLQRPLRPQHQRPEALHVTIPFLDA